MLFIDHTHMFRSSSATILRVYSIKEYMEKFVILQHASVHTEFKYFKAVYKHVRKKEKFSLEVVFIRLCIRLKWWDL